MAPSAQDVRSALAVLSEIDHGFFANDEVARQKALASSRALSRRLETPREALVREIWMQPMASTAIKIGLDMQLFSHLAQGDRAFSVEELAQATNSAPDLLLRVLHLLTSIHMVDRSSSGQYRGTRTSKAFTDPGLSGGMTHLFTQVWPCFAGLPSFLQKYGYQTPENNTHGPWQYGLQTPDTFFDWLAKHPDEANGFHHLMAVDKSPEYSWTKVYPPSNLASDPPSEPDTPLVVDVGGGIGGDMLNLRNALLPQPFRLEVQDLESVVAQGLQVNKSSGLYFRAYNFFDPQPVKGAKAYYMHNILHDWPDHLAVSILQNQHSAMRLGYSKLLLCEAITPERRSEVVSTMDILMMGLLCSKERSAPQWTDLLARAGFRLEKIWASENRNLQPVIEAVPVSNRANI